MHLLDTNVLSELRKSRPHGGVLAWFAENPDNSLRLPAIAIYELQAGAERTRKHDQAKAAKLDFWISGVQEQFVVLPFGALEARITAYLIRGRSSDLLEDAMIASIAFTNDLPLATRNVRDFEQFGIVLVNPFQFKNAVAGSPQRSQER